MTAPKPPKAFDDFVTRYPELGEAWTLVSRAGEKGPLDERTRRLVKIGIAVGALREGAIRSNVRKALAAGSSREEIEQVIALATSTLGFPSTVAAFTWVGDLFESAKTTK